MDLIREVPSMCSIPGILSFALALSFPGQAASSQVEAKPANPQGPVKVATVENMTEYRWPNGLRAIFYPDPSASKVTVNMTILVGSRHEGYGETGMAHLLEHMLFKGTAKHDDIPKALRDRGADYNGTTWVDRTNYYETLPASRENLEFALALEADRLQNSLIRREDLLKEFTVVRNEFEIGENNPDRILSQRLLSAAFEWHNYGKSTIGNRTDIERVPVESLRAFYRKHYRPFNTIVIVSGAFKEDEALSLMTKHFGGLSNPSEPLAATYTEEPPQDGEREVVLRRVGKVPVAGLVYHIPAASHPDFPALEILASALTIQPSGPLYSGLVSTKVASSVSATAFGWHDPGVLEISVAGMAGGSALALRGETLKILDGLMAKGIDDATVNQARKQWLRSREILMSDSNQVGVSLSDWASKGDWRLFFIHRDRIGKVTKADVDRVLKTYFVRSNRTTGLFDPVDKSERVAIPQTTDLGELVKNYKGGTGVKQGEFFEPTIENIFTRAQFGEVNPKIRYALLPKKSRNGQVFFTLVFGYGNPDSLKGQAPAAAVLPNLLRRGTTKRGRQQIEDTLTQLKAQIFASGSNGKLNVAVLAQKDSFPKVLELVKEILREPSFPESEFDILRNQMIQGLERGKTEPQSLAQRALLRNMFPYPEEDVRRTPTVDKSLENAKNLKLEHVKSLYQNQLGAEDLELAAVGDFEPKDVLGFLESLTSNWEAKTPFKRIEGQAFPDLKPTKTVIETPDKENAVYMSGFSLAMRDDNPAAIELELGNFLLGGGTLSSRLGNRVRQKEGLAYSVNSMFASENQEYLSRWLIMASCNPNVMDKTEKAIREECEKLVKEGFTEKEVEEGRKALLAQKQNERSSDLGIISLLADALEARRTADFYLSQDKRLKSMTVSDLNKSIKEHFDPAKLWIVEAGDFAGKKTKP